MSDFPPPDNLHDSVDQQCVARVSEQFEAAWHSGQRPNLRRHLAGLPQSTREALFRKLLRTEVDLRRRAGEVPTAEQYRASFPEHLEAVDDVFASLRRGLEETRAIAHAGEDSTREPPEDLPETGDRYQIVGKVGRGAFATVYLAHDVELDRRVALKVPHRESAVASEAPTLAAGTTRSNFEQLKIEARRVAKLDHAGIVPVYDVGRTLDGRWFLVSKLVEGTSLDVRLLQGKLAPVRAAAIVADAAEALHAAHIEGLVHRDVKPANIMLTSTGRALVTDFGLALHEDEQRARTAEISGSPCYMAPEQTRGEIRRLDGRTDIWALGVVLYRALTGRLPFVGDTWEELASEIRTADPKPPRMIDDAIPAELERIALKCLAKTASERYTTAADLARDLRNWENASSVQPEGRRFSFSLRALGIGISITLAFSLAAVLLALPNWERGDRSTAMQHPAAPAESAAAPSHAAETAVDRTSVRAASSSAGVGNAKLDDVETDKPQSPHEVRRSPPMRSVARSPRSTFGRSTPGDAHLLPEVQGQNAAVPRFGLRADDASSADPTEQADVLLKRSKQKDIDPAERFTLLQLACERALAGNNHRQAREALETLATGFGSEPQQLVVQGFAVGDDKEPSDAWRAIAQQALRLAARAEAANQEERALGLTRLAIKAAEKCHDAPLLERLLLKQRDLEADLAK